MGLFDKLTKRTVNVMMAITSLIILAYIILVVVDLVFKRADPISTTSIRIGAAKDFLNSFIVMALAISVFITSGGAVGLKKQIDTATSGILTPSTQQTTNPVYY